MSRDGLQLTRMHQVIAPPVITGVVGRPGTPGYQRYRPGVRGLKDRVAHLLDVVSGPNP